MAQALARPASRSKTAIRVERVLNTALAGERAAVLNVTAGELLAEPATLAGIIGSALDRPGVGVMGHWMIHEMLRRSKLYDELLNSLTSPNVLTRAGAARLCGATRMTEAVMWLGDMLEDPNPVAKDAAIRALGQMGGRRAVEVLIGAADRLPLHRLAIGLSQAATDVDVEALMRQPQSERVAVATVLACGLRRDVLRVPALLGIAHDRRWPSQVRQAACKSLAMIGNRTAADGLGRLGESDPDLAVRKAAERAHIRLIRRAVGARK